MDDTSWILSFQPSQESFEMPSISVHFRGLTGEAQQSEPPA